MKDLQQRLIQDIGFRNSNARKWEAEPFVLVPEWLKQVQESAASWVALRNSSWSTGLRIARSVAYKDSFLTDGASIWARGKQREAHPWIRGTLVASVWFDWLIDFFFLLTLVNTFIVWLRKVVSTSLGIGKRWAAQSRMHSRVSLCPCQRTRDPPSTHALFSIFCNHSHVKCRGLIPHSHAETQDTSFYFLVWCKVVIQMYSTKIKTQAHFLSCHCSRTHNSIWSFQWFIHWNDWIVCPAK